MKLWMLNDYGMLPDQGGINRHYYLGKFLAQMGHEPTVFVGSHPHNTNLQLIEGRQAFRVQEGTEFPWVLVKTSNYEGSRLKRILSMFRYYINAKRAAASFERPDVILGSSAHPLAALLAVRLGKKYGCKAIVEVRDLWPESIVAFGVAGPRHPAVLLLRRLEKWLYKKADAVVFVMEGAYDYIIEQGWQREIPRSKVFHISNGVDLETFYSNLERYSLDDPDLLNPSYFNVVYTGSIRSVNNLGLILDAAKQLTDPRIHFLIWGTGDELDALRRRVEEEEIQNVIFKGHADKRYIPFIVSHADLNLIHWKMADILRFGVSYNKLFDYLAAGKPIFSTVRPGYSIIERNQCGADTKGFTAHDLAQGIQELADLPASERQRLGENAKSAAVEYDYANLAKKLAELSEQLVQEVKF